MTPSAGTDLYSEHAVHWSLDRSIDQINHGSFGAALNRALEVQAELRRKLESNTMGFMTRELEPLLDEARDRVAAFVGADPAGLALITNATEGVNAIVRSLDLAPGDELLTIDHEYNACVNTLVYAAERSGASVRTIEVPIPVPGAGEVIDRVVSAANGRTRLCLISHVTSKSAAILPAAGIAHALAEKGVPTLVDGAHAPGMVPVDIESMGAAFYTANCHKWMCAPKGSAFLWVAPEWRETIRPAVISHGLNTRREGRSRYHDEFDWQGTEDFSAKLSVPAAIDAMASILPGGWDAVRAHNHALAMEGRAMIIEQLGLEPSAGEDMIGSIAAFHLPWVSAERAPALQRELAEQHRIEAPVFQWKDGAMIRISAQLYNTAAQYAKLIDVLDRTPKEALA